MHSALRIGILFGSVAVTSMVVADTGFGQPATPEDIQRVYWSIDPDGENLPEGSGTVAAGHELFAAHCASCHGPEGEGGLADLLVGGQGSLDTQHPLRTIGSFWPYATTVFDYVRRSMPYTAPMSLSNADYYAITAYLLYHNGIIEADALVDKASLPKIRMPNRDGFVNAYRQLPEKYDDAQ